MRLQQGGIGRRARGHAGNQLLELMAFEVRVDCRRSVVADYDYWAACQVELSEQIVCTWRRLGFCNGSTFQPSEFHFGIRRNCRDGSSDVTQQLKRLAGFGCVG